MRTGKIYNWSYYKHWLTVAPKEPIKHRLSNLNHIPDSTYRSVPIVLYYFFTFPAPIFNLLIVKMIYGHVKGTFGLFEFSAFRSRISIVIGAGPKTGGCTRAGFWFLHSFNAVRTGFGVRGRQDVRTFALIGRSLFTEGESSLWQIWICNNDMVKLKNRWWST